MGIYQIIVSRDQHQLSAIAAQGLPGSDADGLEWALGEMTAAFSSDFVNGRVGERHNTYEHRSRVLRQMNEKLAAMRAQNVDVAS